MSGKIHEQIDELDEYNRFLLQALILQAEEDAGKPLTLIAKQKIADDFFKERQLKRKNRVEAGRKPKISRKVSEYWAQSQEKKDFQWKQPVSLRREQEQQKRKKQ